VAGFLRFFGSYPSLAQIKEISGSFIIDVPPPGSVSPEGTGKVLMVGEFADMTYAVSVDAATGLVTTKYQPVEIFSSQDLLDKVGGWDATLGEFGVSQGNGFAELRNKSFPNGLVLVPLNLASSNGTRLVRHLPTNVSAADPSPVVPLQPALVGAGFEFKSAANRVRTAARATFTDAAAITSGVNGASGINATVAFFIFTAVGETFITKGVQEGDAVVIGVIGAAGDNGNATLATTFRVRSVDLETQLTLETQDGAATVINAAPVAALAYRVHPGATADTGGVHQYSEVGAYLLPARPLDALFAAAAIVSPTVAPPSATASFCDALSGLRLLVMPGGGGGLAFTAAVQAPNVVASVTLDALYLAALNATISDDDPVGDVDLVLCARTSQNIRTFLKQHVLTAAQNALLRMTCIAPALTVLSLATVVSGSDASGVAQTRDERVVYNWPGARTFIPEAVGFSVKGSDALLHTDGFVDTFATGWAMCIMSNLLPERDPAQSADPVATIMAFVTGLQRGAPQLGLAEHKALKRNGVMALRITKEVGPVFQEGITTSLIDGRTDINRRRFADFAELSLAKRYNLYAKLPLTQADKDAIVTETDEFWASLKSEDNPAAARIDDYQVDANSGNTPDRLEQGIFIVVSRGKMTPIGKFIGVQAEIGPTVKIQTTL
jgi:hypothetical protein